MTTPERGKLSGALVLALSFALVLHGAVPFVAVPTLGQAVWTAGFSQSFANESVLTIFAKNFGAPMPAPITFGLAGAYPTGLLIAAGLHPADAYTMMAAFWLSVAFLGAWCLSVQLGVRPLMSVAAALLWLSMPVVWAHAGYSMLSLGIALLPAYFLAIYCVLTASSGNLWRRAGTACLFVVACVVAIFMDGYTFMMFVAGSAILGMYCFARL
jgi:hypothetical protein